MTAPLACGSAPRRLASCSGAKRAVPPLNSLIAASVYRAVEREVTASSLDESLSGDAGSPARKRSALSPGRKK